MVEEASSAGAIEGATMATNWRVWRSGGYISLAERVTQRVPRGGFGEDSAPPAVSCGSWTKAQHQRGGYKRARREQKAPALARALDLVSCNVPWPLLGGVCVLGDTM